VRRKRESLAQQIVRNDPGDVLLTIGILNRAAQPIAAAAVGDDRRALHLSGTDGVRFAG
jgi:hypothetical protein